MEDPGTKTMILPEIWNKLNNMEYTTLKAVSFSLVSVSVSVYSFAMHWEIHEKKQKKSNCLDSHGEEAQKKPVDL